MKRVVTAFFAIVLSFLLASCDKGGDVKQVTIIPYESAVYADEDIDSAIQKVISDFDTKWDGCTLVEIGYAGDERSLAEKEYYDKHGSADQVIVLTSTFTVDSSGGDGSLNPDSTYTGWSWTLVRDIGGSWRHVDHGYS